MEYYGITQAADGRIVTSTTQPNMQALSLWLEGQGVPPTVIEPPTDDRPKRTWSHWRRDLVCHWGRRRRYEGSLKRPSLTAVVVEALRVTCIEAEKALLNRRDQGHTNELRKKISQVRRARAWVDGVEWKRST